MRPARVTGELLGIDLGTLSVKAGLFACDGRLVRLARRSYPIERSLQDGRAEQDPELWWAAVRDVVRSVLQEHGARDLRSLCVGGNGPTLVLVDEAGCPTRRAISWMDTRSERQSARLAARGGTNRVSYSLAPRLAWVAEHEPDSLARTRWALQAWDFVGFRLGGARAAAASTFAGDRVWPSTWLEAADLLDSPLIPPHVDAGARYAETCGAWAEEAGLPPGIPIVGGVNDGIGSIVGAAGSVVGRATDPGGAAGGLALCWEGPLAGPGLDCWPGLTPRTSIVGGAFAAGGRAVDWWAAIAAQGDPALALTLAEQAPPGSGRVLFLPFLAGERAPLWDPHARAAFLGLTFNHGPTHLARAVVESSGYSLRLLAETITAAGGRIDELRICGRQAQSRFWNQVKADVTGSAVSIPRLTEVALMGDAIYAAIGAGFYPDLVSAGEAMVEVAETLAPDPANRTVYDELFRLYRAAYPALKPLFPGRSRSAAP